MKINKKTTAFDLIENYCTKLENMNSKYKFDPKKKILKVKGLNDYIFDTVKEQFKEITGHDIKGSNTLVITNHLVQEN